MPCEFAVYNFQFLEYISGKSSVKSYFTNQWRETSAAFSMNPEDEGFVSAEAEKMEPGNCRQQIYMAYNESWPE